VNRLHADTNRVPDPRCLATFVLPGSGMVLQCELTHRHEGAHRVALSNPELLREEVEGLLFRLGEQTHPEDVLHYVQRIAERMHEEVWQT
jgi:hypothetical protein